MKEQIENALKHLEKANIEGYFEEMDKVEIPTKLKPLYSSLKMMMISGRTSWDYYQQLSVFAVNVGNPDLEAAALGSLVKEKTEVIRDKIGKQINMGDGSTYIENQNLILQSTDDTLFLSLNGVIKDLRKEFSALKELLLELNANTIQQVDKIYNIGSISEANFGLLTAKVRLNLSLTYKLVTSLRRYDNIDLKTFITNQQDDSWTLDIKKIREVQNIIGKGFGSIIGRYLQRLYNTGFERKVNEDIYILLCQEVYKLCLQLTCFALLSVRLDHQDKIANTSNKLQKWLHSGTKLYPSDWRELLKELIDTHLKDNIPNPFTDLELERLAAHLKENSEFYKTCLAMESVSNINDQGIENCQKAEDCLTIILPIFDFWFNYKLVSVKDVKLINYKKEVPLYIKNMQLLGLESNNQLLKLDDKPIDAFSIFMQNKTTLINLSPFVIDINAFSNQQEPLLGVFEAHKMTKDHDLSQEQLEFFIIEKEKTEYIKFEDTLGDKQTFKPNQEEDVKKDNLFKLIKKIFQSFDIEPPKSDSTNENFDNL
ncbi:MAG: hypothetical protein EAZ55_04325 [Cytophagales bacterium]|nr:MAG: hypothetical protein EAZ55_04325 [Cytophagales bacterium]